jgi:hypothetical protein
MTIISRNSSKVLEKSAKLLDSFISFSNTSNRLLLEAAFVMTVFFLNKDTPLIEAFEAMPF